MAKLKSPLPASSISIETVCSGTSAVHRFDFFHFPSPRPSPAVLPAKNPQKGNAAMPFAQRLQQQVRAEELLDPKACNNSPGLCAAGVERNRMLSSVLFRRVSMRESQYKGGTPAGRPENRCVACLCARETRTCLRDYNNIFFSASPASPPRGTFRVSCCSDKTRHD